MGEKSLPVGDQTSSNPLDTIAEVPKLVEEVLRLTAREVVEIFDTVKKAASEALPQLELTRASDEKPKATDATDASKDKAATATDAKDKPQLDTERIKQISREIAQKNGEDLIGRDAFHDLFSQFSDHRKRALALEIMEQSGPNLTRKNLDQNLADVMKQIESTGAKRVTIAVLGENTSGKALGYLARLNTKMEVEIKVLDEATMKAGRSSQEPVLLLDDITKASPAQREFLKKQGKFYASDLGGFDKGFNLWDLGIAKMTGSNQALKEKLAALVDEAARIKENSPTTTNEDAVRQVLKQEVYKQVMTEFPDATLLRSKQELPGKNKRVKQFNRFAGEESAISDLYSQISKPQVTPEQVEQFLKNYGPLKQHAESADYPKLLEATAKMLRDGVHYTSYPEMLQQMKELHGKLAVSMKARGQSMENVLIITQMEPSSSGHLVQHLYSRVNGLTNNNFISAAELERVARESPGSLKGKTLVYLDDYSYSGRQPAKLLGARAEAIKLSGADLVVAHLGAFQQKADPFAGSSLRPEVINARSYENFYSPERLKSLGLSEEVIRELGGNTGYLKNFERLAVETGMVLPYRGPNNNVRLLREFSEKVIKQPNGAKEAEGLDSKPVERAGNTAPLEPIERKVETTRPTNGNGTGADKTRTSTAGTNTSVEETSEFYESQDTRPQEQQSLRTETKRGANGVDIITDSARSAEVARTLEKYNQDEAFQKFLERKATETKDETERRRLQEELENYRRMAPADRAKVREAVVGQAIEKARSGGRGGSTVGRVLSVGGTVVAVGMLMQLLVSEAHASTATEGRATNPEFKQ
jgi:hypothetical protein